MNTVNAAQAVSSDNSLPAMGFSRQPAVRKFAGGVASSTLWLWVRQKKIPAPIKISPRVAAWRNEELHQWAADPLAWQAAHKGA